ncbi:MAG: Zn-dependent oligopeptidase [Deltaproteobacteria bacterium]|nr:Zn-dependent oligopeptidase [Deltaproteobacteria bacterium]
MNSPAPQAARALAGTAEELTRTAQAELARAREAAERLAALPRPAGREEALGAYEEAMGALGEVAARAGLARNVHPDAAFRDAAEKLEQEADALATALSLDRRLHDALAALPLDGADAETRWLVEKSLRDFRRSGVDRDEATRRRVQELRDELTRIGQEFGRNIKDDVRRLALDPADLAGLPEDWRRARPPGPDGKVTLTTDPVDYVPFMTYAERSGPRERLYRLYQSRGHPQNEEVLRRLLSRRQELARLLGYPSWAAYATEDKMIGSDAAAGAFVEQVAAASAARQDRDFQRLLARLRRDQPDASGVEPWDSTFLQERIRAEEYGFDARQARPYFEYRRVKDGVLDVTARLFGISYRRVEGAPTWHADVESWDVLEGDRLLGRIHLDMHPREGKYKHFAQFTLANGARGRRLPEGVLVCNFPRPGAEPALLEHGEVKTLFHEFGHLLHHVLGGHTRYGLHAGVATEWDFVEAPSQLLEEWTWDPSVLAGFARHVETGAPIPAEMVARMRAADEYGKGLWVRQQMFYAAVSLELHRRDPAGLDAGRLVAELRERFTPFRHVEGTHMHLSFGHLDGYSALYYTYMWSLVIAKDLFTAFQREGLMGPAARRYRRAVLEPGGSRPAAALVRDFLGREQSAEAFGRWLEAG